MFMNPFIEGVILIVLGIGCVVLGHVIQDQTISATGQTLTGLGFGYIGGKVIGTKTNGGSNEGH